MVAKVVKKNSGGRRPKKPKGRRGFRTVWRPSLRSWGIVPISRKQDTVADFKAGKAVPIGRKVRQKDAKTGKKIAEYPNCAIAGGIVGVHHKNIYNCARGAYGYRTAGGFKWEFINTSTRKIRVPINVQWRRKQENRKEIAKRAREKKKKTKRSKKRR